MTGRAEAIVERIRRIEARADEAAAREAELANERAGAIRELHALVGPKEAADLLGVTVSAIYKAIYRGKPRKPKN